MHPKHKKNVRKLEILRVFGGSKIVRKVGGLEILRVFGGSCTVPRVF